MVQSRVMADLVEHWERKKGSLDANRASINILDKASGSFFSTSSHNPLTKALIRCFVYDCSRKLPLRALTSIPGSSLETHVNNGYYSLAYLSPASKTNCYCDNHVSKVSTASSTLEPQQPAGKSSLSGVLRQPGKPWCQLHLPHLHQTEFSEITLVWHSHLQIS
jgi:hypothetical protein